MISAQNIDIEQDPEFARETLKNIREKIRTAPELEAFRLLPKDWSTELAAIQARLHLGTSKMVYDEAGDDAIVQKMADSLFSGHELGRA